MFVEAGQSAQIALQIFNSSKSSLDCRFNGSLIGSIDENSLCRFTKLPEITAANEQPAFLSIYENNVPIGIPLRLSIYRCDLYESCDACRSRSTCTWCQGRCLAKRERQCSSHAPCTSLRINDFSPRILPVNGETLVTIYLNDLMKGRIKEITLADVPCVLIKTSNRIECQARPSNTPRRGSIRIQFDDDVLIFSKEPIEYRQSRMLSFTPTATYEFGGQSLHITGNNLLVGNWQQILIGRSPCVPIKPTVSNALTCRLPSLPSGLYNVTVLIDKETVLSNGMKLRVTPNPVVQDINPITSFARYDDRWKGRLHIALLLAVVDWSLFVECTLPLHNRSSCNSHTESGI